MLARLAEPDLAATDLTAPAEVGVRPSLDAAACDGAVAEATG
jgi:hypothetical protein